MIKCRTYFLLDHCVQCIMHVVVCYGFGPVVG